MGLKEVFIQNLKKHRQLRQISQMRLAELCGTSTSYIGQIEIGNRFPSLAMIEKFAKALQIKPYLLFVEDPSSNTAADIEQLLVNAGGIPDSVKEKLIKRLTAAVRRIVRQMDEQ